MDRWDRAEKHGLCPPPEVKDLITSHASDPLYTEWYAVVSCLDE